MAQRRKRAQALNVAMSLAHLPSAPAAHKLVLNSITEIANHLPTLDGTVASDADLEHYLNALYRLGRQRHTPNISPANTVFLQNLLQQQRPKNVLEIGSANGYSALRFWQVVRGWHARITTMDVSEPNIIESTHHFATTGADHDIELHFGNALQIMPNLPAAGFDFIFIDARKILTLDFFIRARRLVAENGLIVIDDVLKFKEKMHNLYDHLAREGVSYRIEHIVDDEDGVMLIG